MRLTVKNKYDHSESYSKIVQYWRSLQSFAMDSFEIFHIFNIQTITEPAVKGAFRTKHQRCLGSKPNTVCNLMPLCFLAHNEKSIQHGICWLSWWYGILEIYSRPFRQRSGPREGVPLWPRQNIRPMQALWERHRLSFSPSPNHHNP